jgi:hypothetical protein
MKQQFEVQTIVLASARIIPTIKIINMLLQITIIAVTMPIYCILTLTQSKKWQASMLEMGVWWGCAMIFENICRIKVQQTVHKDHVRCIQSHTCAGAH